MSYRRKKLIVLLGVAVLGFSSVTGCTSGNAKETDGTETIQESRTEENSNLTETEGYQMPFMIQQRDSKLWHRQKENSLRRTLQMVFCIQEMRRVSAR